MTPKEKAQEVIKDFRKILDNDFPRKEDDVQYNFIALCNAITSVNHIIKSTDGGLIIGSVYWGEVFSELHKM